MKCRECSNCKQGWYSYLPNHFVCIGVPEPFIIGDIDVECTEYKDLRKKIPTEDLFVIGFDNAPNGDHAALVVKRIRGNKVEVINAVYDKEAIDLYKKLTNW